MTPDKSLYLEFQEQMEMSASGWFLLHLTRCFCEQYKSSEERIFITKKEKDLPQNVRRCQEFDGMDRRGRF